MNGLRILPGHFPESCWSLMQLESLFPGSLQATLVSNRELLLELNMLNTTTDRILLETENGQIEIRPNDRLKIEQRFKMEGELDSPCARKWAPMPVIDLAIPISSRRILCDD